MQPLQVGAVVAGTGMTKLARGARSMALVGSFLQPLLWFRLAHSSCATVHNIDASRIVHQPYITCGSAPPPEGHCCVLRTSDCHNALSAVVLVPGVRTLTGERGALSNAQHANPPRIASGTYKRL